MVPSEPWVNPLPAAPPITNFLRSLSDADVDRVARRILEILRAEGVLK